ncbi:potassium transporter 26-like [Rhododendron vialii]|uniref:potassium transporter 26-like n=1 Tax=Rhododendron vialii TaxID=182163 RepID=UPI00265E1222|nr:potassium transporter 26-like [Rhododendron vialii]XP_058206097.1 potassium transporter 26-like [Rhododendron vialii]
MAAVGPDNREVAAGTEEDVESGSNRGQKDLGRDSSFGKKYETYHKQKEFGTWQTLLLAYQSLGVVYGDIGTSPLYVMSSVNFKDPTEEDFLGILSLIFWTLTLIPLIKYVFIVLRADDHGEGGTFALYSFLCRHLKFKSKLTIQDTKLPSDASMRYYTEGSAIKSKTKNFIEGSPSFQNLLTFVVLLGTCMVIGDGALTPATSVLSALVGIQSLSAKITQSYVIVMSVVLLLALFLFQRFGTSKVGFSFSPIMLLWFSSNVMVGIYNICKYYPPVLKGLSPHYMIIFFVRNGMAGWAILGAVFLCVTGGEAMFADLGHFNKRSIQMAFSTFVFPALVITYAGQTAYLIKNPGDMSTAFYSTIPKAVYWPMFVIATLSAIVASQSMISASFSIVKQSLALGCFPRVNMKHTSSKYEGQIYSPEINYILMVICIALVVGFRDGVQIGNAYGVVVIWVMIITTCLVTLVMLVIWDLNFLLIIAFFVPFIIIEGIFMTSLLSKILVGGWAPFAISFFFLIIMLSWTRGRSKKTAYDAERRLKSAELSEMLSNNSLHRPPGICFFCTDLVNGIPPIIRHYIQHTGSVRQIMVIVTIRTLPIKSVLPEERFDVGQLGVDGVYRCLVQFGYKDSTSLEGDDFVASVVAKLSEIAESAEEAEKLRGAMEKGVVFVTGRTILKSKESNGWLDRFVVDKLYRFFQKNSRSAVASLKVPPGKTLQVGMLYEI